MAGLRLGPDAQRYVLAGAGHPVARPFNVRWFLPSLCRDDPRRWYIVWALSWPLGYAGAVWWSLGRGAPLITALATGAALLALPGVLGPVVTRPVGVDLPAMALSLLAAGAFEQGWWPLAFVFGCLAVGTKESAPVWLALWVWSPLPLVLLLLVPVAYWFFPPQLDSVTSTAHLRRIHDHPVRTAIEAHASQWRDAWVMVAPWGVTLLALVEPSPQVLVVLFVAYAQFLVATDNVRLVQTAAGPVMALAAMERVPERFLVLVLVLHLFWWRKPERI